MKYLLVISFFFFPSFLLTVQTINPNYDEALADSLDADVYGMKSYKEKLLEAKLYSWYGSAALPAYLEVSDKIWKMNP